MKTSFLMVILASVALHSCGQAPEKAAQPTTQNKNTMDEKQSPFQVQHTDEEWQKILTPEQYEVLRLKGTEAPFTGKYYLNKAKGMYVCAACGNELFTSDMKFNSPCGWPSFDREIAGGHIITRVDSSHGMIRTEILCAKCGSHLGHIFDDGPTETGMRYCVNSVSLDFKKDTTGQ